VCVSARFLTIRADAVEADAFDFPLWQVCAAACGVGPAEVAFLDGRARLRVVAGAGASAAVANPRCADLVVLSLGGSAAASALLPLSSSLLRIAGACQADMQRLLNFVDKTLVEDVIPILQVASHSEMTQVLEKCVQRIARSDFDDIALDKELAPEAVILWFAAAETMSSKSGLGEDSGPKPG